MPNPLEQHFERWKSETLAKASAKMPERPERTITVSGRPIDTIYVPHVQDEAACRDYLDRLGFPGEYPFTRGVQPTMYRSRFWTMRQYAGFATAEETNQRYRFLLEHGQTGLSVAFDLPTQIGYDSNHPLAAGEVGKVGVAIDTLADMELLFESIPLDQVSTSMTINSPAAVLLAMYIAVGAKQGVSPEQLTGTIQNDVLKEYIARGTHIFPPAPSLRLITDIFAYAAERLPRFNTISVSGYHMREAGATAEQEIGFTLADGIAYVEAAVRVGLDVDKFAPRMAFFFGAMTDVLEEVAKFRAARRLWARIVKERFGAKNPRSGMLRFHTQTCGATLTAQQIDNNVVRVALQALAAVLGGTQSLHTNSRDEALALPTEEAVQLALRTQQIIAHESGVAQSVDPLAGSYYVERLTDQIEAAAEEYIKKIDEMGGMIRAIEQHYPQSEIEQSSYRYQQEIERGERVIVGVNRHVTEQDTQPELLTISTEATQQQLERLNKVRAKRDAAAVTRALDALEEGARRDSRTSEAAGKDSRTSDGDSRDSNAHGTSGDGNNGDGNLMPLILDAVQAYATIGEICDRLRKVFGEYEESIM
ncbi:MAG: methylmalonyl-CoA mutase family protein [Phycisphaerae bacterium]|nr:methylmalonyl-CoA mutase family protein [Phycisphaerae bacterium]